MIKFFKENDNLLTRYLRENHAKLKGRKTQPARLRKFNKIKSAFEKFRKNLLNTSIPTTSHGNVVRKKDKYLHALLTVAQQETLIQVNAPEAKIKILTPWYSLNYLEACLGSFNSIHPCIEAREAVVLEAAKNKVSVSSK